MAVPTAHHLLATLAAEGLLAKGSGARFTLGPKAVVIADCVSRQADVPEYLLAPLRELAKETGETSYLAAWKRGDIRILDWVESERALRVADVERGPYRLAHARATGKLLLAYAPADVRDAYLAAHALEQVTPHTVTDRAALEREFDEIRQRGWSEDREEFMEGVACLSGPVIVDGVLIAALTISSPVPRFEDRHEDLRKAVLRAAGSVNSPIASDPDERLHEGGA